MVKKKTMNRKTMKRKRKMMRRKTTRKRTMKKKMRRRRRMILNLNLLSSSLSAPRQTTTVANGPCGSRALMVKTWKPTVTLFVWATTTVLG